jgi:hypothetical protein
MLQFLVRNASKNRRIGNLVAIQMQHWQHGAVANRIEKLVRMPGGRQRPGFGLTVANHYRDDEIRVVEGRAIGVRH